MKCNLGTKADTLKQIYGKLKYAEVLPQFAFTLREWHERKSDIVQMYSRQNWDQVIVRSSALNEDTSISSQAGRFESVGNVKDEGTFRDAVTAVIDSYEDENEGNQILVQPMLKSVKMSGVAFTLDPNTAGNYYVINYDESGSTSSVTSGNARQDRLLYIFKGAQMEAHGFETRICDCLRELEQIFDRNSLDVEFAVDGKGEIYILQVRPLCISGRELPVEKQRKWLDDISGKIVDQNSPKPFLYGKKTIYGVMPDWNPAEIIGVRPKPLALSLYKEIVTDTIWAYQRNNYGYRNLRSFPLLIDFYGLPYIDVRVSFNSFIPAQLSADIAEKLVNYYLDKLENHPDLHDKIEFEIAFTCYTPDLPDRIKCLAEYGFTDDEISEIVESLRNMTNVIIDNEEGLWKKDYRKIQILESRYQEIMESDLDYVSRIYWLLEDCKRYGTLPFAGLARAGFIAVQLMKSLINMGIILETEYNEFMGELGTVSSIMKKDKREMSKAAFLKKYGHLRPGTYDICSKRYDEAPDIYFDWERMEPEEENTKIPFKLSLKQIGALKTLLREHGMADDVLGFFHFIRTAIEGREYAKFVFTKSLSEAIRLFGELGETQGISADECAYADVNIVTKLYASSMACREVMEDSVAKGKEKYQITEKIVLPPLICDKRDVFCFYYMEAQPNYITLKQAFGEIFIIDTELKQFDLAGKIILMESADPGYDWIFSHRIAGFITKYGGANSHMAIRANELQIPAVIGVGEKMFESVKRAKVIQIDTSGRKVDILK